MCRSVTFTRSFGLLLALAVTLLDQWSKALVIDLATRTPFPIEITSFFNIVLTGNRGISFGMLRHHEAWAPLALVAATSCVALGLLVWMLRARQKQVIYALGLVVGGALGNIIDRARLGAVTDFLDVHWGVYHWPAFNVADSAIFVGVVLLAIDSIVQHRHAQPVEKSDHASS